MMELMVEILEHDSCPHCGLVPVLEARRPTSVVCESPAMQALFRRVARFAHSDAPVVITGESGTGKEVVARLLHANGPRAGGPFVAVNAAALPAELLESELFGHAKGAFTGAHQAKRGLFQEADGGTLFLDEIGEMPLALQAKLLRALQDGEIRRLGETRPVAVDVRIVCATNRDLERLIREGSFREDLYYRLKVLHVKVPPLRDRREDILPLARLFLRAEVGTARAFSPEAKRLLLAHDWPGNVRELANAVKYAAVLATGEVVESGDLPEEIGAPSRRIEEERLLPLHEVERRHVLAVLEACDGRIGRAAEILGIGRNTLWRKLRRFETDGAEGASPPERRKEC